MCHILIHHCCEVSTHKALVGLKNSAINPSGPRFFPFASVWTTLVSSSSVSSVCNILQATSENLLGMQLNTSFPYSLCCSSEVGHAYNLEQKQLQTRPCSRTRQYCLHHRVIYLALPPLAPFPRRFSVYSFYPRIASIGFKTEFFTHPPSIQ